MQFRRLLLADLALSLLAFAAADGFVGTWKINTAKSSAGTVDVIQTITATSDGYQIGAKYPDRTTNNNLPLDGKDHPLGKGEFTQGTMGAFKADTRNGRRISDSVHEVTFKREGKTVAVSRRELSADGRAYTQKIDGTTPDGKRVNLVFVWDKQ
jgi:hypothetical protein